MQQWPDVNASITGFSDGRGDEIYNLELSRRRASAVEQYLVDGGIERYRLYVDWQGSPPDFTGDEFNAAGLANEQQRVVLIRISGDSRAVKP